MSYYFWIIFIICFFFIITGQVPNDSRNKEPSSCCHTKPESNTQVFGPYQSPLLQRERHSSKYLILIECILVVN